MRVIEPQSTTRFHGEMKKARERILTTADGEVGWLLKFIQTDLDTLTPE